jgi:carbon storage regulator
MLVLTRRIGEEIVIADEIRVKVLAVSGQRVRLGITAPSSVPVARMELLMGCTGNARLAMAERISQTIRRAEDFERQDNDCRYEPAEIGRVPVSHE